VATAPIICVEYFMLQIAWDECRLQMMVSDQTLQATQAQILICPQMGEHWAALLNLNDFLDQELITYCYWSCSTCSCCFHWGDLFKKAIGSFIPNPIRVKFGRNVLSSKYTLMEPGFDFMSHIHDGSHNVILHRKELPPGEWKQSFYQAFCQFLICSTFVLATITCL